MVINNTRGEEGAQLVNYIASKFSADLERLVGKEGLRAGNPFLLKSLARASLMVPMAGLCSGSGSQHFHTSSYRGGHQIITKARGTETMVLINGNNFR